MAFTRTSGPSERAKPTVIAFRAPFDAIYAIDEPIPIIDATDEMLTIPVTGLRFSSGANALVI
jgi:hypothetical protein